MVFAAGVRSGQNRPWSPVSAGPKATSRACLYRYGFDSQAARAAARAGSQGRRRRRIGGPETAGGESRNGRRRRQVGPRAAKVLMVKAAEASSEFDAAFATIVQARAGALLVVGGPVFTTNAGNSSRWRVVTRCQQELSEMREYADDGGLMSYGASQTDGYRRAGISRRPCSQRRQTRGYAGRTGEQVRIRDQHENRQGARAHGAEFDAVARRRDHRIERFFSDWTNGRARPAWHSRKNRERASSSILTTWLSVLGSAWVVL